MKYVYEKPIPLKSRADKDERRKSTATLNRRKPADPKKRQKHTTTRERRHSDSDGDFVYRRPESAIRDEKIREAGSKPKSRISIAPKATAKKPESKKATESRQAPKRRHTEPVRRRDPCEDEQR